MTPEDEVKRTPGFSLNMMGKLSPMSDDEATQALEEAIKAIQASGCCQYYVSVHYAVKDENRRGKLAVACLDERGSHIEEATIAETMQRIRRELREKEKTGGY